MSALLSTLALMLPAGDGPRPGPIIRPDRHHVTCGAQCDRRWRVVRPHRPYLLRIAACESGRRWHIATGNGFYGGLQFTLSSWSAVGGHGYPHWASPLEQMYRAVLLSRVQGWGAWPVCSR